MILLYTAFSFVCGTLVAKTFEYLPAKWLCDYGETPTEMHSRANRHQAVAAILLFGAICAIIQAAFIWYSADERWVVNYSVMLTIPILLLITLGDIKYNIIPNELLVLALLFGAPFAFRNGYLQPILGALTGGGLLFAIFFIGSKLLKKEAMGFGDVLLSGVCGYLCGTSGYIAVIFIAVISAAIILSAILICKKTDKDTPQPFAPFLVAGVALVLCFSSFWQSLLQRFFYY